MPMTDTNADPMIGCQINHYVIGRRLGQGGMGVVYQGRHVTLERDVAIKFLPANLMANTDYVERFFREARAAAHLNHPNIISVQDAGTEDTVCYFVMEYVEGRDLAQLLKEHNQFSEGDAIRYGIKVANAMAYAHKANIIHRDIKPENLFLSNSGELKVGDLGLAKQTDEQGASLTMSGVVVGTPYYISPEQIRGAKDLDARTDIYSLGATLYHLVTGRVPYRGSSAAEIMAMHLTEPFPWPQTFNPQLSDGFCQALCKMMAKNKNERFQNMEEVAQALQDCLEGRASKLLVDVDAPASAIVGKPVAPVQKPRSKGGLVAAVIVMMALAAGGAYLWFTRSPETSAGPTKSASDEKAKPPPSPPVTDNKPAITDVNKVAPKTPRSEDLPQPKQSPAEDTKKLDVAQIDAQLIQAIKGGDVVSAISLINKGPDRETLGQALRLAATNGKTDIVKELLTTAVDINAKAPNNLWTALMNAASTGQTEIVRLLLEKGADVNAKDPSGWTALTLAAGKGYTGNIKLLIDHGAEINFKGAYGNTALLQSLGQGQLAAAEFLISRGADCNARNDRGETALTLAQQKGYNKIVEALQKAGATAGATDGKSVDVKMKNASGKAALLNAVGTGNLEAIPALAKGQDAETLAQALKLAVTAGSIEPIKVLIAAGANPNTKFYKNWTPFLFAVQAGHTDVIRLLLGSSADANAKTDDGWTPLILAIRSGRNENVQLLATSGADLNLNGVGDNTPLMDALSQGQLVAAEYLIRKRVNVNAKNSRGETALVLAQQHGHAKIVDLLKQVGAKE